MTCGIHEKNENFREKFGEKLLRNRFGDLEVEGSITLKYKLEKQDVSRLK
jgi:hypothetical protein